MKFKPIECYYCNKMIENYQDHVKKEIPLHSSGKDRMVARDLHIWCVKDIAVNVETDESDMKRDSYFDKCYELMKKYLDVDGKLPKHALLRLLGMKLGKFIPNSENVIYRKTDYDFEIIYKAMLFASPKIQHAKKTVKFTDTNHKINYFMTIIASNLDLMAKKVKQQRQAKAKLEKHVDEEVTDEVYVSDREKEVDKIGTERLLEDQKRQQDLEDEMNQYFL